MHSAKGAMFLVDRALRAPSMTFLGGSKDKHIYDLCIVVHGAPSRAHTGPAPTI